MANKYKIVYDLDLNEVITVVPYDTAVSDSKGLEIINKLQEKIEKVRSDKNLINPNDSKAKILQDANKIFDYIDTQIGLIKEEISNYSSTTYTTYNVFVANAQEAKEFFDSKGIDYSKFLKDLKKP